MRKQFVKLLLEEMSKNKDIYFVTADLGYKLFDPIRDTYPNRFVNTGASEQAALGLCVGLALSDKIPVFYSISTFAILRGFETIRNYMSYEQIPVKIIGGGRDDDYHIDGYSHDATDLHDIMNPLKMEKYYPENEEEVEGLFKFFLYSKYPCYMNLRK